MYLKAQDYVEEKLSLSTLSTQKKTAIKNKIKAFVPSKGKMLYKEVVDAIEAEYIAKGEHIKNDDICNLVKEVDAEWTEIREPLEEQLS